MSSKNKNKKSLEIKLDRIDKKLDLIIKNIETIKPLLIDVLKKIKR